jgi:hypothetical protein
MPALNTYFAFVFRQGGFKKAEICTCSDCNDRKSAIQIFNLFLNRDKRIGTLCSLFQRESSKLDLSRLL